MSTPVTVSVVVATRNRAHLLRRLLDALQAQEGASAAEVVVVDDASTDDTTAVLQRAAEAGTVVALRLGAHGGPAQARNAGWSAARGEHVAFTDDDCEPEPGWLAALVAAHAAGADVVQGRTVTDVPDYGSRPTFSRAVEVPVFSHLFQTCNVSYRRDLLAALGGFDEAFGTSRGGAPNGEDADLGWRATAAGARAVFADEAVVVHPLGPSSLLRSLASRPRSFRMAYFLRRHPGFRQHLHHGIFLQASHPAALASLLGLVLVALRPGRATGVAAVLSSALYVRHRTLVRPLPGRRRALPLSVAGAWLVDVADVTVLAAASVRFRCLLL